MGFKPLVWPLFDLAGKTGYSLNTHWENSARHEYREFAAAAVNIKIANAAFQSRLEGPTGLQSSASARIADHA